MRAILDKLSRITDFSVKGPAVYPTAFTHRYVTAQVFDELGSWHIFPLKESYITDGRFLVRIGKRMLALSVDLSKIKTYRYRGSKAVQTILYTSKDAKPIDPTDIENIKEFCDTNNIKKFNHIQAILIRAYHLLQEEREERAIGFGEVVDDMLKVVPPNTELWARKKKQYTEAAKQLGTRNLKGPLEPICSYLGARMQDNPNTIANVVMNYKNVNYEWKEISNPAKSPFGHWMLVGLIVVGAIIGVSLIWYFGGSDVDTIEQIRELSESGLTPEQLGFTTDTDEVSEQADNSNSIFDFVANTTDSVLTGGS